MYKHFYNIYYCMDLPIENQRVKKIIDHYFNGNENQFSKEIGVSQPRINRLFSLDSRNNKYPLVSFDIIQSIINKFININPEWLIVGRGDMEKSVEREFNNTITEPLPSYRKTKDKVYDLQRVPLFNLEATMGLVPVVNNNGLDEEKIIDYISIPAMAICDGAIYASGDSMYPLLKAGDMVAYKKIDVDIDNIFFGEIYILALYIDQTSTMKTIKFVQKSDKGDDYIRLVSQNPHHADKDIRLNQIAAMGLVRASIRLHN